MDLTVIQYPDAIASGGIVITLSYAGSENNLQIILTIPHFSYSRTSPFYSKELS
jgi:hypothetical protein